MSAPNQPTYLQAYFTRPDTTPPDDQDLARYLKALGKLNGELNCRFLPNPEMDAYLAKHPAASHRAIDMSSSFTCLPPHEAATNAGMEAGLRMQQRLTGRYDDLRAELHALHGDMDFIEGLQANLVQAKMHHYQAIAPDKALVMLARLLKVAEPEVIEAAKKNLRLPGAIEDCLSKCSQPNYVPHVPHKQEEQRELQVVTSEFMLNICKYELEGVNIAGKTPHIGMRKKSAALTRELYAEEQKLPTEIQLQKIAFEEIDGHLKTAIAKALQQLHGLNPRDIKPANINVVSGSSTALLDAALGACMQPIPGKKKPKLLLFGMSWDGLKTKHSKDYDLAIIPGPVSAKSLEDYIQTHILKGKHANNPERAADEASKAIGGLLVNIPENPLGKMPTEKETKALAAVIKKYHINRVILDEIFACPGHTSLSAYPGMKERCYLIASTSKNINSPSRFSYGYTGDAQLAMSVELRLPATAHMRPIEAASFSAILSQTPLAYYTGNQSAYAKKRRLVTKTMARVSKELKHEGALQWLEEPNYGCLGIVTMPRALTDAAGITNSCELAEYVYKTSGIKTMAIGDVTPTPGQPLGIRINFSDDDDILVQGIERLGVALRHMQEKQTYQSLQHPSRRGADDMLTASELATAISQFASKLRMDNAHD